MFFCCVGIMGVRQSYRWWAFVQREARKQAQHYLQCYHVHPTPPHLCPTLSPPHPMGYPTCHPIMQAQLHLVKQRQRCRQAIQALLAELAVGDLQVVQQAAMHGWDGTWIRTEDRTDVHCYRL